MFKVMRWSIWSMPKQSKLGVRNIGQRCTNWLSAKVASIRSQSIEVPVPVVSPKRSRVVNSAANSRMSNAKLPGKPTTSKPATAHQVRPGSMKSTMAGIESQLDETDSVVAVALLKQRRQVDGNG